MYTASRHSLRSGWRMMSTAQRLLKRPPTSGYSTSDSLQQWCGWISRCKWSETIPLR
jgi:hypothetical protein